MTPETPGTTTPDTTAPGTTAPGTPTPGTPTPGPGDADAPPQLSMLLIAYRQAGTVAEAIAGALAQTGPAVEIIISDDASGDDDDAGGGTWAAILRQRHQL